MSLALAAPPRLKRQWGRLIDLAFWLTVASGSVVFIEPSPYDGLILIAVALWLAGGVALHRAVLPFALFLSLWTLGGFIALIPYWHEEDPVSFMLHTLFISSTGLFYALFLSVETRWRAHLLLTAYAASCVLAAAIATTTWLAGFGEGGEWIKDGRAMAPFKDPNVLGSYLVTGALYLLQRLLLGSRLGLWRGMAVVIPALALILAALFLSFSRGSWGAMIFAAGLMAASLYLTADDAKMRRRILGVCAGALLAASLALAGALSQQSVRDFFFQRAAAEQDYDAGPNGRFGNQARSLPMLLDRPNGFGPLRFRLTFGLEPHNSYINAFASNGWLGGFAFLALTLATFRIGFRQIFTRHPFMRPAQVLFPATFVFFVQGLQIDIDHWRMFYVSLGAVWGLEAARRRWLAGGGP